MDTVEISRTTAHLGADYLSVLQLFDTILKPQTYLEIGTNRGASLALIGADALAIDPEFLIETNVVRARKRTFLFQMPSDEFFRTYRVLDFFPRGVDLCLLDGMHRAEYLLRDFLNAEQCCHRNSIILLHDCLPTNARMAERSPRLVEDEPIESRYSWTGDVWRLIPILKRFRPDLRIFYLDCPPTGLVACTRLDPTSRILADNYHAIVDFAFTLDLEQYTFERLWRDFPTLDTRALLGNPSDLTSSFNIW